MGLSEQDYTLTTQNSSFVVPQKNPRSELFPELEARIIIVLMICGDYRLILGIGEKNQVFCHLRKLPETDLTFRIIILKNEDFLYLEWRQLILHL